MIYLAHIQGSSAFASFPNDGEIVDLEATLILEGGTPEDAPSDSYEMGDAETVATHGIEGGGAYMAGVGVIAELYHVESKKHYKVYINEGDVKKYAATLRIHLNAEAPNGQYNYKLTQGGKNVGDGIIQLTTEINNANNNHDGKTTIYEQN